MPLISSTIGIGMPIRQTDGTNVTSGTVDVYRSVNGGVPADTTVNATYDSSTETWRAAVTTGATKGVEIYTFVSDNADAINPSVNVPVYDAADFKATGFSTFDHTTDEVTTDAASRTASQADVSALATASALATVDANVDAILVDTGTTLPGTLSTIDGKIDTIDTNVDAILVDTDTTLPGLLTIINGKVDVVDGIVDDILVDTGTTLPAAISGISSLDAAGVRTAIGLASANLDTQIGTLATAASLTTVDGIVDDIKLVTEKLDTALEETSSGSGIYRYTTAALALAPTGSGGGGSIIVSPISTTLLDSYATSFGVTERHLRMAQASAGPLQLSVVDVNGDAVDLSAKTLRFVVFDPDATEPVKWTEDTITIGGASSNQVTITIDAAVNTVIGEFRYALWNLTDDQLIGTGRFDVFAAPKEAAS